MVFVYAELVDKTGNKVPLNGQKINFKVTGALEIMNPGPAMTEQGSAAVLVRIGRSLVGSSITAEVEGLSIVSPVLTLSQE